MDSLESSRYRAPALEKGLDILELMAREQVPQTMSQLSERLGRSKGEIFRMIQVLEERLYIARRAGEDGYSLTNRLFTLGMEQPPFRGLLETSLPVMHRLAETIWQSCHLVLASQDQIVVIARVDAPGEVGFAVRLGHRLPLQNSTSGRVLFAFQPPAVQEDWLGLMRRGSSPLSETAFLRMTSEIRARGHARDESVVVRGVVDISAPVLQGGAAIAALTAPCVERIGRQVSIDQTIDTLKAASQEISTALKFGVAPT